jgi:hypothetical protein
MSSHSAFAAGDASLSHVVAVAVVKGVKSLPRDPALDPIIVAGRRGKIRVEDNVSGYVSSTVYVLAKGHGLSIHFAGPSDARLDAQLRTILNSLELLGVPPDHGIVSALAERGPLCAGDTKSNAVEQIAAAFGQLNGTTGITLEQKLAVIERADRDATFKQLLTTVASKNSAPGFTSFVDVKLNSVTCTAKKTADVGFDLVLGGQPTPGLAPAGHAVLDRKTWKIAKRTACDLLAIDDPTVLNGGPCSTP